MQECSEEETLKALRGMGSFKAPGPDGYQAVFFKNTWRTIGADVMAFVRSISGGGILTSQMAEALLVLIPKKAKPLSMREFRLLSLCNKVYKLVSKIIVSRLREVWKFLITPFQASFVSGRQSVDNVVMCQEFVHSMRLSKARKGSVIIKLDLDKAYDRLEWDFIEDTMLDAGLPQSLVLVIMRMVRTGSCRLVWNGELADVIRPSRGLRQGCPLPHICLCFVWRNWVSGFREGWKRGG